MGCDPALQVKEGAKAAIEALKNFLYNDLGLQSTLTEVGIDGQRLSEMAHRACKGKTINGYRILTPADVEEIYKMCL